MKYRKLENLGIDVSLLGFGCMRFPTDKNDKIDPVQSEEMIDLAYKSGVNYFDTAYVYHGGESEVFTGKALKKYNRSSFYLATKLPCWAVKNTEDAERIFNEQLERLGTDYIDFYLLHALGKDRWHEMLDAGIVDYCIELQKLGKIKYLGFSFHDDYAAFEEIISYRKWDFCQIQLNYMDKDEQAGLKGYELAKKLDVPIIVMEPIKGGSLANLPDDIMTELKDIKSDASTASWAMRWVASLDNVKVVLSGMSNLDQVKDNLKTFEKFEPLSDKEEAGINTLINTLRARVNNSCTGCRYCMPCPAGVDIPATFGIWNEWGIYGNKGSTIWNWGHNIGRDNKPDKCIDCGACEDACPQKIKIRDDLKTAAVTLDNLHW